MKKISLNNKCFVTKSNQHGLASVSTIFKYKQIGNELSGTYSGGPIKSGHIIGLLSDDNVIELLYHCIDLNDQLLAGSSKGKVVQNKEEKIEIVLTWEWLFGASKKGESHYIEI